MSPEAPDVSICFRDALLLHFMGILDRIVSSAIDRAHTFQPCTGSQVPQVARFTDAIPRLTYPGLHLAPHTSAMHQDVDVWRTASLEFEKPQHTNALHLAP